MHRKFIKIVCASLTAALLLLGAGISYGVELDIDDKVNMEALLDVHIRNVPHGALEAPRIEKMVYDILGQCLPSYEGELDTPCLERFFTNHNKECDGLPEGDSRSKTYQWTRYACKSVQSEAARIADYIVEAHRDRIAKEHKETELREMITQYKANADKILGMVKGQYLTEYPKAQKYPPLGEALENFCSNPTWTIALRDVIQKKTIVADYTIVFTGVVLLNGQKARFSWQIEASVDDPSGSNLEVFHTRFSINGNNMSRQEINNLLAQMYLN